VERGVGKDRAVEQTAVLIAPDRELARQFQLALHEARSFQIVSDLKKYPTAQMLEIRLRQFRPAVVLVEMATDAEAGCELVRFLVSRIPPVTAVCLDYTCRSEVVMRALREGASEFLAAPFEPAALRDAATGVGRLGPSEPAPEAEHGKIFAFASIKPGSGASVLACHTAFALQRFTRRKVLLADLDLAAGTVGFYTQREHTYSFLDVLEQSAQSEFALWSSLTVPVRGVDVLPAPPVPREVAVEPIRLRQSLDQVRRSYDWGVLDLPSVFHRVSLLALAEADRTFLVTTAELPSLHLARKTVQLLLAAGIGSDRFEVVINQVGGSAGMSGSEIEKILGCRVRISLPEDHASLHEATALGAALAGGSALGETIDQLACGLAGVTRGEIRKSEFVMDPGPVLAGT
jgi:pilus assembly protein CpaE